MKRVFFSFLMTIRVFAGDLVEERFVEIYEKQLWGTVTPSGEGSLPENLHSYIDFLSTFIRNHHITSICDLGCGDFSYFRTIDLTGVRYIGIDIVKGLVDLNRRNYGTDNISFIHGNIIHMELPEADLAICKHVLQHLPNESVFKIIDKLKKYRYCILLDQCQSDSLANISLPLGKSRPLDLSAPPFNLKAKYWRIFDIFGYPHKMLLIEHPPDQK